MPKVRFDLHLSDNLARDSFFEGRGGLFGNRIVTAVATDIPQDIRDYLWKNGKKTCSEYLDFDVSDLEMLELTDGEIFSRVRSMMNKEPARRPVLKNEPPQDELRLLREFFDLWVDNDDESEKKMESLAVSIQTLQRRSQTGLH